MRLLTILTLLLQFARGSNNNCLKVSDHELGSQIGVKRSNIDILAENINPHLGFFKLFYCIEPK